MGIRLVFMGTPDFAVESLKSLYENNYNIVGVITAPDKPAGRGRKINESAVKKYAISKNLNVLQPTNLKSDKFIEDLRSLNADLQIVVAFRMLPEIVWNMPKLGTFNLHGSLLPQYRGAAPINWAIINGETKTGITTFFISHNIDTGDIIDKKEVEILEHENVEDIHDKLMIQGAKLLVESVAKIENGTVKSTPQDLSIVGKLNEAPKIFKQDCKVDFTKDLTQVYNHIRGLSPYPAAYIDIEYDNKPMSIKLFGVKKIENEKSDTVCFKSDKKTFIKILFPSGAIDISELQLSGKKRMKTEDLLRGFKGDFETITIK